jgi:hypothetical protein
MSWKSPVIVLAAVAFFAAGFAIGRVRYPTRSPLVGTSVRVPHLTGRRLEAIDAVLARLHVGIDAQSLTARADKSEVGTVLTQLPKPGSVVPVGTKMSFTLSAGAHPKIVEGSGPNLPAVLVGSTCDLHPQLVLTATPCVGGLLYVRLE